MARTKDPNRCRRPHVYLWRMGLFVILAAFLAFIQYETVVSPHGDPF
jgi:hypothetical protein